MTVSHQCLSLAGLDIGLQPAHERERMVLPAAFAPFLSTTRVPCRFMLNISELDISDIHSTREGDPVQRAGTEGLVVPYGPPPSGMLWEVRRTGTGYRIDTFSHSGSSYYPLVIEFKSGGRSDPGEVRNMRIKAPRISGDLHPFGYPAGGLIVYLISSFSSFLLVHASAIETEGRGLLFAGVTGSGKSTMASLWEKAGARVIHDDRLILRALDGGWKVFSTPVNPGDRPGSAPLEAVFIISHGRDNRCEKEGRKESLVSLLEHCVQHHYDPVMVENLTDGLLAMVETVPVYQLSFRKDQEVIEFIRSRI